jgi:hypothetical protein
MVTPRDKVHETMFRCDRRVTTSEQKERHMENERFADWLIALSTDSRGVTRYLQSPTAELSKYDLSDEIAHRIAVGDALAVRRALLGASAENEDPTPANGVCASGLPADCCCLVEPLPDDVALEG